MPNDETVNVRYIVDDVDESVAFYTELLGFEVLTNFAPAFADVKRGNLVCCCPDRRARQAVRWPTGRRPAREAGTGSTSSSTTSTPRSHDSRDAGATFRNDIVEGPGGKQVLLQDPSGNFVELFQPAGR